MAMNPPDCQAASPATRPAALVRWLALAVTVAWVGEVSVRRLAEAESVAPLPATVARFRLEQREGRYFRPGAAAPFTGWITDHFAGGQLRLRSAAVEGRLQGESVGWFTNGVVELRERFQRGLPHGLRLTWHENGRPRSEGWLVAGQQHGAYRLWHENGRLAAAAEFTTGKPHGLSRAWYPDGSLKAEALMNHGEVQARQVYPDGTRWEPTLLAGARKP